MRKARILIVDDSLVIRRLLSDTLAADPELEVIGAAANGRIGLAKIEQQRPDLVTLDMEMPDLDGMATLAEIRRLYPDLPVIMFSAATQKGAQATLDALAQGASDYVTKPSVTVGALAGMSAVRDEMIPKIKALCKLAGSPVRTPPTAAPASPRRPSSEPPKSPPGALLRRVRMAGARTAVIAIGVSTGGPNALTAIFRELPSHLPPIVIVQHMPPIFTRHLAERLSQVSRVRVKEAQEGDVLAAGGAWIAPGGFHMELRGSPADASVHLHEGAPENHCRPAVDVLFRSVADVYGANVLAVVLTGMGSDGLRGCEVLHRQGARIIAQDEASSVVWGMPGAVVQANLADEVLPLPAMAGRLSGKLAPRLAEAAP